MDWHRVFWYPKAIPKHAFILWVAINNRLATKDKLRLWGLNSNDTCVLCNGQAECRNHLFFECSFSADIWKKVLILCAVRRHPRYWQNELLWATHGLKGNSFGSTIKKMAWAATIYHIWCERNRRIH